MEEKGVKTVIVGKEQSGKTSWVHRLVADSYTDEFKPTTAPGYHQLNFRVGETDVDLSICDYPHEDPIPLHYVKATGLFLVVWDTSQSDEEHLRVYLEHELYYLREAFQNAGSAVEFKHIPIVFIFSKTDAVLTPLETLEAAVRNQIDIFQLSKANIVITSAKENKGVPEFKQTVCALLKAKAQADDEAAVIAAFNNLQYQETECAHTRGARFATLNVPALVQKNPTQLTEDEFEWLLRQWRTINDRKSLVSLWIERRLAYALNIYTNLAVPYGEEDKRKFDEYLAAHPVPSLPKVDEALQLLSRKETGFFIKIGCFFSSTYWARIKDERIVILEVAQYLNTCAKLGTVPKFDRWGELSADLDRIVRAPALVK